MHNLYWSSVTQSSFTVITKAWHEQVISTGLKNSPSSINRIHPSSSIHPNRIACKRCRLFHMKLRHSSLAAVHIITRTRELVLLLSQQLIWKWKISHFQGTILSKCDYYNITPHKFICNSLHKLASSISAYFNDEASHCMLWRKEVWPNAFLKPLEFFTCKSRQPDSTVNSIPRIR